MRKPWKELLPVQLLPEEMLEMGQRLSQAITKRDKLEDRRKHVGKLLKERVDKADAIVHQINRTVATGYEDRDVLCMEEVDLFNKKIRITRLDTYAVVKERDMEPHELQTEIRLTVQAERTKRMDGGEEGEGGEGGEQNVLPFVAGPGAEVAAPTADLAEEQQLASTPEEAEVLREQRLAAERVRIEKEAEEEAARVAAQQEENFQRSMEGNPDAAPADEHQEGDAF